MGGIFTKNAVLRLWKIGFLVGLTYFIVWIKIYRINL